MKKVFIILVVVLFSLVGCDSFKTVDNIKAGEDDTTVSFVKLSETLNSNNNNEPLNGHFLDFEIDKKISNELEEINLKLFIGHAQEVKNYWIDEVTNDELSFSILLFSNANIEKASVWYLEKDLISLSILDGFDYYTNGYNARLGEGKIEYDYSNIFSLSKNEFIIGNQGQIIMQIVVTRGLESIDLAQREFYYSISDGNILFSLTAPTSKLNSSDGWTQSEISIQNSVLGFVLPFPSNTIYHFVIKYELEGSFYIQVKFEFDSDKLLEEGYPNFYCKILEAEAYKQIGDVEGAAVYQKNIDGKIVEIKIAPFSGIFGYMLVAGVK